MEAIVRSIKQETRDKKAGGTFKTIDIVCDVTINKDTKEVRQLTYSKGVESVVKYFKFCGVSSEDLLSHKVKVDAVIGKRMFTGDDGEPRTYSYIKYLNVLDESGEPIIMKSEEEKNKLPF